MRIKKRKEIAPKLRWFSRNDDKVETDWKVQYVLAQPYIGI